MWSPITSISAGVFFALWTAVAAVGMVSWQRTKQIRGGSGPSMAPGAPFSTPSSRLTMLAAWAGVAASTWGVTALESAPPAGVALIVFGGFIAAMGCRARVTSIDADPQGMTVRYGRGPPFVVAWSDLVALHPPRTPLGGWRLQGRTGACTLMPSDLWGKEALLGLATRAAGLRFHGGSWRRLDD